MKKIILFTVVFTVISILTACGNNVQDTEVSDETENVMSENSESQSSFSNYTFVKEENGYRYFDIKRNEFIEKYDKLCVELAGYKPLVTLSYCANSKRCDVAGYDEIRNGILREALTFIPNADKYYSYDTTLYPITNTNPNKTQIKNISIFVDENDNVLQIMIGCAKSVLSTNEQAAEYYQNVECAAGYEAITGEHIAISYDTYGNKGQYEYGYLGDDNFVAFTMRVLN